MRQLPQDPLAVHENRHIGQRHSHRPPKWQARYEPAPLCAAQKGLARKRGAGMQLHRAAHCAYPPAAGAMTQAQRALLYKILIDSSFF